MPRLVHAVLCQQVLTDTDTNAVTYINVLEEIEVSPSAFPLRLPPVALGTLWVADGEPKEDSINVRVRVTTVDGKTGLFLVDPIPMETKRHRHHLTLMGVTAPGEGDVVFHLETATPDGGWIPVAVLPFSVDVLREDATSE